MLPRSVLPGGPPRSSPNPMSTPSPYDYKPSSSPSGSSPFPLHFNNPSPTPLTGSLAFPGDTSNPSPSPSLPAALFMNSTSSPSFGGASASSNTPSPSSYGGSSIPPYNPNPYSPPENYSAYSNRMYLASCLFSSTSESWLKTEQQRIQEEEAKLEAAKIKNLRSQLQQRLTEQYQLLKAEVSSLEQDKSVYGKSLFFFFHSMVCS